MYLQLAAALLVTFSTITSSLAGPDLRGVWEAQVYRLKSGRKHTVDGTIFFSEERWMVLFFVLDGAGEPKRASAEGGTYHVREGELEFSHLYHFSQGNELPGLA